ncbi:hypothetical protein [Glycomyces algeriensis]|uniref:Uncharacterized protein n=1 Tax=Glycomyces algeriensis TaxID=256037 RepID=A0A9W6LIV0_9ACTN|nr:hypothetical protein [Glycomyces algeriensis]MDA1366400.1 hypothetical protein [Glycomyces algeriensis]MDR7352059.1 hypothetical protein [Glycomyces algeriensis]GLI44790.1 hypothetical protein GALLR39Z86_46400 [Glycomyces algeriensis]
MARVSQWNWSDFTQEWSQTSAINELDEELAAERASRRRQLEATRDQFKQGLKQVDSKLDSVAERIEAVLDWTELRFQQVEFDEYQARKEIRNTVRALAEGRAPLMRGFEDVSGYWLPSAAAAVLPLVLRDRVPAQRTAGDAFGGLKAGLERARERDAVRTELFSLAVGRCFDQPAFIDAAVLRLLSEPADLGVAAPGQVAWGWRTLWEQAATGAFGPAAEAQIAALLRERFDAAAIDEEALKSWDEAIERFGADELRHPTLAEALAALATHFAEAPGSATVLEHGESHHAASGDAGASDPLRLGAPDRVTAEAGAPLDAVEALDDQARISEAAGTRNGDAASGGAAVDPLRLDAGAPVDADAALANQAGTSEAAWPRSGGTAPDGDASRPGEGVAVADSSGPAAAPPHDDLVWRSYLQELIEEPSDAELPIVREMAALDPAPEGRETDRRSWSDPAGTLADLVRRDLFDPEAPIPLRRLALGLAAPVLRERLDRIEAALGTTEKAVVTVRRRGEYIEVTRDGHDPDQFAVVERRIEQAFAAAEPSKPLSYGIAAALGLLGVLMVFLGQWFAAVLFVLAAVIPLWKYRSDAAKAGKALDRRDEQLAETRAALVKARKDAEARERAETERGLATRRAIEHLLECLPAGTAASALGDTRPAAPGE